MSKDQKEPTPVPVPVRYYKDLPLLIGALNQRRLLPPEIFADAWLALKRYQTFYHEIFTSTFVTEKKMMDLIEKEGHISSLPIPLLEAFHRFYLLRRQSGSIKAVTKMVETTIKMESSLKDMKVIDMTNPEEKKTYDPTKGHISSARLSEFVSKVEYHLRVLDTPYVAFYGPTFVSKADTTSHALLMIFDLGTLACRRALCTGCKKPSPTGKYLSCPCRTAQYCSEVCRTPEVAERHKPFCHPARTKPALELLWRMISIECRPIRVAVRREKNTIYHADARQPDRPTDFMMQTLYDLCIRQIQSI
jgi:hypothetical protein